ncbi:hypothetical protein VTK26DRAFT_5974 [Humicola hyalothermophila]
MGISVGQASRRHLRIGSRPAELPMEGVVGVRDKITQSRGSSRGRKRGVTKQRNNLKDRVNHEASCETRDQPGTCCTARVRLIPIAEFIIDIYEAVQRNQFRCLAASGELSIVLLGLSTQRIPPAARHHRSTWVLGGHVWDPQLPSYSASHQCITREACLCASLTRHSSQESTLFTPLPYENDPPSPHDASARLTSWDSRKLAATPGRPEPHPAKK